MERALTVAVEGLSEGVSEDLIPPLREAITALHLRITELQTNISYNDEKLAVRVINMMTVATASNSTNHTSGNHTSENHTSENEVDSGSIAFMMFSTVLVLLMTTPGIMLYYSGMVRLQNALSTAIQAYVIASLVTFLWLLVGYSICFGSSSLGGVVGSLDKVWLRGVGSDPAHELASHIPEYVFCSFHLAFAIITPSLICGAFANRMKFWSVIVFLSSWHLIVYCPIVHCFWHPAGWLSKWGVQDFAGGCVVHISAGFSALISALMVGKRKRHKIIKTLHPHNKVISAIGASLLNVGWYGFNAGSALHATPQASMAFLNTQLACGTASVTWMIIDLYCRGVPSFDGIMNGSIAGLVAITPCAGYVDTTGAFIVGFLGGAITSQGVKIKEYFNFDDALDAFGIHGVAGVTGMVMSGLLAKSEISGAPSDQQGIFYGGSFNFLGVQLVAIVFTISWGCLFTAIILKLVDKVIGLRVSQHKELIGLDASEHGNTPSQMQKVPQPRRLDRDGGDDFSIQQCWPFSCFKTVATESNIIDTSDLSSSQSSKSTLTEANKQVHDNLSENKKIDVIVQMKKRSTMDMSIPSPPSPSGDSGSLSRSNSSSKGLSDLGEINIPGEEKEVDNSLSSLSTLSFGELDHQEDKQSLQVSEPEMVVCQVQNIDDYYVGCDIDDNISNDSGQGDYF